MSNTSLDTLENSIAYFEGYGLAGSVATRNNNPGDLMYATWEQDYGATGHPGSIAQFPDAQSGFDALDSLVQSHVEAGDSTAQLINAWSPANAPGNTPTSTQNYINYVSGQLGVDPNAQLSSVLGDSGGPGAGPSTQTGPSDSPSWWQRATDALQSTNGMLTPDRIKTDLANGSASGIQKIWLEIEQWFTDTFGASRIAAVLVGLIAIAGGIYLFKPVQNAVTSTVKLGSKAVALA